MSPSRSRLKKILKALGPFFGLVLVTTLFMAMLALKDVTDQMEKETLTGFSGWQQAAGDETQRQRSGHGERQPDPPRPSPTPTIRGRNAGPAWRTPTPRS